MSAEYEGQDKLDIAAQAERDLNSAQAKVGSSGTGHGGKSVAGGSDSSTAPALDNPYILTSQ